MNASAQIVNLGPEVPSKVVAAVSASLPEAAQNEFSSRCNKLIAEGNALELIRQLLQCRKSIFSIEKEETIEGCYIVMFHLSRKVPDPHVILPKLYAEITESILGESTKPLLRLKLATNMYNMLPLKSNLQFEALLAIIKYTSENGLFSMLRGFLGNADTLFNDWDLSVSNQRTIFLLLADAFEKENKVAHSQKFLLKYLETFSDTSKDGQGAEVKAVAARAAVGILKSPISSIPENHTIFEMLPIQSLRKDKNYEDLFELLRIFNEDTLDSYINFSKKKMKLIEKYGLEHEKCISNMRLLSICSLAKEFEEIPYSEIAKTIQVSIDDVEEWIINATQVGLLEAKIDQVESKVIISRYTCRVFEKDQWVQLQGKLRQWKTNVSMLLETIQKSNEIQTHRTAKDAVSGT